MDRLTTYRESYRSFAVIPEGNLLALFLSFPKGICVLSSPQRRENAHAGEATPPQYPQVTQSMDFVRKFPHCKNLQPLACRKSFKTKNLHPEIKPQGEGYPYHPFP